MGIRIKDTTKEFIAVIRMHQYNFKKTINFINNIK